MKGGREGKGREGKGRGGKGRGGVASDGNLMFGERKKNRIEIVCVYVCVYVCMYVGIIYDLLCFSLFFGVVNHLSLKQV